MQKYKQGDRVKVLFGHPMWSNNDGWIDIAPYLTEDVATVEYSYGEKSETDSRFSKDGSGYHQYSLKFDKYGSVAWFNENTIIPA